MSINAYDPGRARMKARLDEINADERAPDRQFGVIGGLVIAIAASLPLWWLILFVAGIIIGRLF